jgi:hypothetical protein
MYGLKPVPFTLKWLDDIPSLEFAGSLTGEFWGRSPPLAMFNDVDGGLWL